MSEEIKVRQTPPQTMPMAQEVKQRAPMLPWVILGVVVIIVVILGFVFRGQLFKSGSGSKGGEAGVMMNDGQKYQAVFLTNGQVYFGKINKQDKEYMTLNDIYYLQVGPQQGSGTNANSQQSISLVKLGNELHGPVDEMHITKTQVLFWEDLKNDGNVVSAILKDKADKAAAGQK